MSSDTNKVDTALLWDLFDLHACIGSLLRKSYGGMSGYEIAVLLAIRSVAESPTIGHIATSIGVTSQYASSVIGKLRDRGYVVVIPGEDDRRQKRIVLTGEGDKMCAEKLPEPAFDGEACARARCGETKQAIESVRGHVEETARVFAIGRGVRP